MATARAIQFQIQYSRTKVGLIRKGPWKSQTAVGAWRKQHEVHNKPVQTYMLSNKHQANWAG